MAFGFSDHTDIGIWPLQDHDDRGIKLSVRQQIVGGRVDELYSSDESDDPQDGYHRLGLVNQMGTIGDVHPWAFLQTRDRGERGTGSWAQAFLGVISEVATGTVGGGGTGLEALPVYDGAYTFDERYAPVDVSWPRCMARLPESTIVGSCRR